MWYNIEDDVVCGIVAEASLMGTPRLEYHNSMFGGV